MSGKYISLEEYSQLSVAEIEKMQLNAALDKYAQPMRPGPDLAENHKTAGQILRRGREVIKSSKGKHGTNFTPAKKKRKR